MKNERKIKSVSKCVGNGDSVDLSYEDGGKETFLVGGNVSKIGSPWRHVVGKIDDKFGANGVVELVSKESTKGFKIETVKHSTIEKFFCKGTRNRTIVPSHGFDASSKVKKAVKKKVATKAKPKAKPTRDKEANAKGKKLSKS